MTEIRKMLPADIDEILGIEKSCFTSEAWSRDSFEAMVSEDFLTALVCTVDGVLAGYVCGSCVANELEIHSVAVREDFRRMGIARALIGELETLTDPEAEFLEVRESNAAAISLYESLGFRLVGRRKGYYREPDEDARVYCKEGGR